jgi:hypothetical protein
MESTSAHRIALGLGASYVLTRLMSSLLFEVSATDPTIFLVDALLLLTCRCLPVTYQHDERREWIRWWRYGMSEVISDFSVDTGDARLKSKQS